MGEISKLGTFNYDKRIVPIYLDVHGSSNTIQTMWQSANPDAFYQGPCFMSPHGKITYPDGVEVKEPTIEDRKKICKFILVSRTDIENFQDEIYQALEKGDLRHNR